MHLRRYALDIVRIAVLAAVYFGSARLGLAMAFLAEQVTVVWPPTGIALAALLLFGYRLWPGVFLGALLANFTSHEPLATACGIAVGNTLEALTATWLLRQVGFGNGLERLWDVLALLVLAAAGSTVISATIGVASLCLSGLQPWSLFAPLWRVWWLGDALGALVMAPLLLTWAAWPRNGLPAGRGPEAVGLTAALVAAGLVVFAGRLPALSTDHPLEYTIFPFVIWAALRLGQPGTTLVTFVASAIAIWGTVHDFGPFAKGPANEESLILLQAFMGIVAVTALLLGAATSERDRAERRRAADHAVTLILAESTGLPEAGPRVLQAVCEHLRWDVGVLWSTDRGAEVLRCAETWHAPDVPAVTFLAACRHATFAVGVGLPGRVWAASRPAWITDVADDANFPQAPAAAGDGLHGAFAFPITIEGKTIGVVEFLSRDVRQPDADLLLLFATIGSQMGQFLDRKRSAGALRETEERYRRIVETANEGIWLVDTAARTTFINRHMAAMLGYRPEEMAGRTAFEFVFEEDRAAAVEWIGQNIQGVPEQFDFRFRRKDGAAVLVLGCTSPVLDAAGQVVGALGMFTDVTERRRAAEERAGLLVREQAARAEAERLYREAREADRRKDEFLAMLAHELRNPLSAVTNALHVLGVPGADGDVRESTRALMARQVRHLTRLVDDLLDVSRLMRGKITLRREPLDLAEVVSRAVEAVRPLVGARRQALEVALPPDPLRMEADPMRLEQVLINLLNNAAKYTEEGGRISLTAAPEDGEIVVRVRDTGMGIAPELLPRVFDLFVQADQSLARSQGGLGIGLTMVRSLTEMHGGRVEAHSAGSGRGSEFVVRLPLLDGAAPGGAPARERVAPAESAVVARRVLVVDDNDDAAQSLALVLRLAGHHVQVAHDGPEALALAGAHGPEVVLLDIGLPGMDGYEVATRLREMDGLAGALLVAVTGYGQDEDRRRTRAAGIALHLTKPVAIEELRDLVAGKREVSTPAPGNR
jgi:PAS domain S-box-containing protein